MLVRAGAGNGEEAAVVAAVVLEATDLAQAEAVAVEGDDGGELVGVAGDAQLHHAAVPRAASALRTVRR